jgi:2-keto-3-deoxy-L-arabinonate dehydratase
MTMPRLEGIYPILATAFLADGRIDEASQARLVNFCIESGAHGLVTLANASEGHLLADEERRALLEFILREVDGRIPVVATINHPAARVAADLARSAEDMGASAVMSLPPFFGRWRAGPGEILRHFEVLDEAITIPIVFQDHVLSDIALGVDTLVDMAQRFERFSYVKLEAGNIIHKTNALVAAAGTALDGVFGGNSGVFLPEEHAAGCTGTMPACYMPDVFRRTWDLLQNGEHDAALRYFAPFSRIAAYEKDVANRCVWKSLLVERHVIDSAAVREPVPAFAGDLIREQLHAIARAAGLLES